MRRVERGEGRVGGEGRVEVERGEGRVGGEGRVEGEEGGEG